MDGVAFSGIGQVPLKIVEVVEQSIPERVALALLNQEDTLNTHKQLVAKKREIKKDLQRVQEEFKQAASWIERGKMAYGTLDMLMSLRDFLLVLSKTSNPLIVSSYFLSLSLKGAELTKTIDSLYAQISHWTHLDKQQSELLVNITSTALSFAAFCLTKSTLLGMGGYILYLGAQAVQLRPIFNYCISPYLPNSMTQTIQSIFEMSKPLMSFGKMMLPHPQVDEKYSDSWGPRIFAKIQSLLPTLQSNTASVLTELWTILKMEQITKYIFPSIGTGVTLYSLNIQYQLQQQQLQYEQVLRNLETKESNNSEKLKNLGASAELNKLVKVNQTFKDVNLYE
jgi:hypothetical protein